MREQGGGVIVNTASISGLGGDRTFGAYNAAKGAVVNYTRTLAMDHGPENIRTNAVCPGAVDTPIIAAAFDLPDVKDAYIRTVPLRRIATAEDIAAVILFLASDDARHINGVVDLDTFGALERRSGRLRAQLGQPFRRIRNRVVVHDDRADAGEIRSRRGALLDAQGKSKPDLEGRAVFRRSRHGNRAAHFRQEFLGQIEADTDAVAAYGRRGTIESFEYTAQLVFRDADTVVFDGDNGFFALYGAENPDDRIGRCIFDSVGD